MGAILRADSKSWTEVTCASECQRAGERWEQREQEDGFRFPLHEMTRSVGQEDHVDCAARQVGLAEVGGDQG